MRRIVAVTAVAVAALATAAGASAAGAQRPNEHASCAGFLANSANPNAAFVLHTLVKPAAEAQGMTLGEFQREVAQEHPGVGGFPGLLLCIPEL